MYDDCSLPWLTFVLFNPDAKLIISQTMVWCETIFGISNLELKNKEDVNSRMKKGWIGNFSNSLDLSPKIHIFLLNKPHEC